MNLYAMTIRKHIIVAFIPFHRERWNRYRTDKYRVMISTEHFSFVLRYNWHTTTQLSDIQHNDLIYVYGHNKTFKMKVGQ